MNDEISIAKIWKWGILGVLGITVLVAGSIWIATATSGARGHAGVVRKNNSSDNQISAQFEFNRVYGDIQRDVTNIKLATDPENKANDQKVCAADVATYNADAQDTTLKEWRPDKLPETIDVNQECGIK